MCTNLSWLQINKIAIFLFLAVNIYLYYFESTDIITIVINNFISIIIYVIAIFIIISLRNKYVAYSFSRTMPVNYASATD